MYAVPVLFVVNGPISERVETKGFTVNLDHVIVDTWNSKPKVLPRMMWSIYVVDSKIVGLSAR